MGAVLAGLHNCTGCMACVDICHQKAITRYMAEDGHYYVKISDELCVSCKKCERLCADIHHGYGINDFSASKPFSAWANDEHYRERGTSGGVFAALSKYVIQDGGCVVGASFDGFNAKHICIDKVSEISFLQGSKYVQSNTEGIYSKINKRLPFQKVLFFGLGCQVSAVLNYFKNHPQKDNLLTVDMVCGGVPSSLLISKFRNLHPELEEIVSFREKRKYLLKGKINGEIVCLENKPLPLAGFMEGHTNRYSCYDCVFAKVHRDSNITIGDLWGNKIFPPEDYNKGVSLVIVHDNKGMALLNSIDVSFKKISWADCLPYNPRIGQGTKDISVLRKRLSHNAAVLNDTKFSRVYTANLKPSDGLWFYYLFYWRKKRSIRKKVTKCIKVWKKFISKY